MSITRTNQARSLDHFQPEDSDDPQVQKRRRAHLEQIDYAAYAANREVIGQMLGTVDAAHFQRLAVTISHARGQWLGEALRLSHAPQVSPEEGRKLAALRSLYEELSEAYEGLRRLIERGHTHYRPPAH